MDITDLKQFREEMIAIAALIDEPDSIPGAIMRAHKVNSSTKWNPEEDARHCDDNIDAFLDDFDAAVDHMLHPP